METSGVAGKGDEGWGWMGGSRRLASRAPGMFFCYCFCYCFFFYFNNDYLRIIYAKQWKQCRGINEGSRSDLRYVFLNKFLYFLLRFICE